MKRVIILNSIIFVGLPDVRGLGKRNYRVRHRLLLDSHLAHACGHGSGGDVGQKGRGGVEGARLVVAPEVLLRLFQFCLSFHSLFLLFNNPSRRHYT